MLNMQKATFIVMLICGISLSAYAQPEATKLKKLSKKADIILTGKVTQKKSDWNEAKTRIYTKATLQVDEYLKGDTKKKSVEITYMGGEVGEIGELYSHAPTLSDKEEVLVFLKKDKKNNSYKILNGNEGKIKVFNKTKSKGKITDENLGIKALKAQIQSYINEE